MLSNNMYSALHWSRKAIAISSTTVAVIMASLPPLSRQIFGAETKEQQPEDKRKVFSIIKAKAESGDLKAQHDLALCYVNGDGVAENNVEATKWFRKAAERGLAVAQRDLGTSYYTGNGVVEDKLEAEKWFRKAAMQGNRQAQYNLGFMYSSGDGVAMDKREALKWYLKAAEQGLVDCQYFVGKWYLSGIGVSTDESQGVAWIRKAADNGKKEAQNDLGWCYQMGIGLAIDFASAEKWYQKASAQGYDLAKTNLEDLRKIRDGGKVLELYTRVIVSEILYPLYVRQAAVAGKQGPEKNTIARALNPELIQELAKKLDVRALNGDDEIHRSNILIISKFLIQKKSEAELELLRQSQAEFYKLNDKAKDFIHRLGSTPERP